MYNPNQVSVSGTKTKAQFWYKYQSQYFFSIKKKKSKVFPMIGKYKYLLRKGLDTVESLSGGARGSISKIFLVL